jgi:hypothetical protein
VNAIADKTGSSRQQQPVTRNRNAAYSQHNQQERKYIRFWAPINSIDIWRYIGCLLYMEEAIERKYTKY